MAARYPSDEHVINFPKFPVGPKLVIGVFVVLLLIGTSLTCFYTVKTEEVGVVLRFGKFIKTVPPGLHYKMPFLIDYVELVPVKRQLKQEFGFGTTGASDMSQYTSFDEQEREKSMVTGDLNAALVEWVIQYRVETPEDYLFHVRDPRETLRHVSEAVMREVVGDRTVDEVITVGRQDIENTALLKLQEKVNDYQMGLRINQVQLKDVNPPEKVQSSFNEVNQAQQEREQMINVANGEYNRDVPRARGEAEKKIQEAEGYRLQRINEAEGDATKFSAQFEAYRTAPEVTRQRLYLETISEVLPEVEKKIIIDEDTQHVLPLLQLNPTGAAR